MQAHSLGDPRTLHVPQALQPFDSGEYRILFALETGEVVVLETDGAEDELTVAQTAERLGTTPSDVRQRIRRRHLTSEPGQIVTIFRVRHRREVYRNL